MVKDPKVFCDLYLVCNGNTLSFKLFLLLMSVSILLERVLVLLSPSALTFVQPDFHCWPLGTNLTIHFFFSSNNAS